MKSLHISVLGFLIIISAYMFLSGLRPVWAQSKIVGGVYSANQKILWFKAEDLVGNYANGQAIDNWPDASIHGFNAYALEPHFRPFFIASDPAFNNRPVVQFNEHMLRVDDDVRLDGMQQITMISVVQNTQPPAANGEFQGIIAKHFNRPTNIGGWGNASWAFYLKRASNNHFLELRAGNWQWSGNRYLAPPTNTLVHSAVWAGGGTVFRSIHTNAIGTFTESNNNIFTLPANRQSPVVLGNNSELKSDWFKGKMAEIIVLNTALNNAQRLIVDNVLACKYGFELLPVNPARYFLSGFENSNFNHEIIGIGGLDAGSLGYQKHSASLGGGGGLYLAEVGNTLDQQNEFVFAGHNNATHGMTSVDVPGGAENADLEGRWSRVWKLERTVSQGQGNGTSVRLAFDFDEADGLEISPQNLYVLLYRETPTGTFTRMDISSGASGNRVSFVLSDADFKAGYYTIARSSVNIKTWVSASSGPWNSPATWEGNSGFPGQNPLNDKADNIIINNSHDVVMTNEGNIHGDLLIKEGGTLIIDQTRGHSFGSIRGKGTIRIDGNYFPSGDAAPFHAFGGGTTLYTGETGYVLNATTTFNNLAFDLTNPAAEVVLRNHFTLNGDLRILAGNVRINDAANVARNITVKGNVTIGHQAGLFTGTGNARHKLTVQGDFTNNGVARFSNLNGPSYTEDPTNGMVDVIFNARGKDQVVQVNGITEFYRIEIFKSVSDSLFLRADDTGKFFLFGRNNLNQIPEEWWFSLPNPNALGLVTGILVVENNVHIPVLKSREGESAPGNFLIDAMAQLVVRGGVVETPNNIYSIGVYGSLVVLDGVLRARGTEGVALYNAGRMEVRGGYTEMNTFRTSVTGGIHRGAYIQSGGTVVLDRKAGATNAYFLFSLPYVSNSFAMTGGDLIVQGVRIFGNGALGGILINAGADNQTVTGGTVTAVVNNGYNFIINSSAPFYNLNLRRTSNNSADFLLDAYPGGTGHNPPGPVDAQSLRVLRKLTIEGGENFATLDLNGHELVIEGDLLIETTAGLAAAESTISFTGAGNSTLEIQNQNTLFQAGVLSINKNTSEARVEMMRTGNGGNSQIFRVNDLLSAQKGTLNYGAYNLLLSGNLEIQDRVGENNAPGRLIMDGNVQQNIMVTGLEPDARIGHLEIENEHGVKLKQNSLASLGQLTLTRGVFDLGTMGVTVEGDINGTDFGVDRMIATAGGHSNAGLSLLVSQNKEYNFPLGTTSGNNPRYTPVIAEFDQVSQPVYVQINPVDQELSTLGPSAPDNALTYYWRVNHSQVTPLPRIVRYEFRFDITDLPSVPPPAPFVPGKIVNLARSAEDIGNFNLAQRAIFFTNNGVPFPLEKGEYTAALEDKFFGSVTIFYSRLGTDLSAPASWHTPDTWSTTDHDGLPASQVPGPGDLVQLGFAGSEAHAVAISGNVNIAGLHMMNSEDLLPVLILEDASFDANLGIVSGEGKMAMKLGAALPDVSGDFSDFIIGQMSEVIYRATNGVFAVPSLFETFPGFTLEGPPQGEGIAIMNLPESNLTILRDFRIRRNARVIMSNALNGDVFVRGDLNVGTAGLPSQLLFPETGQARTIRVLGNVVLDGAADTQLGAPNTGDNIEHRLIAESDILHNSGSMRLFYDIAMPRVRLELRGEQNASYSRFPGAAKPYFYKINMDKGNSQEYIFSFLNDFYLSEQATEIEKPIVLKNGILDLAGNGTEITLINGNSYADFVIPSTSGLILRNNVVAKANARNATSNNHNINAGINLAGLLKLQDNAQLRMADLETSRSYIEYSTGGTAQLEISDNALIDVAHSIRGQISNNDGVLRYKQTGGNVVLARNFPTGEMNYLRGVFEIYNPGSLFHFTGGNITIIRETFIDEGGHRPGIYLKPAEVVISNDATIHIGSPVILTNSATVRILADSPIPNLRINGGSNFQAQVHSELLTIEGDVIINNGKTLALNGKKMVVKGDFINNGIFAANIGTVQFSGDYQWIKGGITTFHNVIANPGFELGLENNMIINGNLQILSGAINDWGYGISLRGHAFNQAAHISPQQTGGLFFDATSQPQQITGQGLFGRVILNNDNNVQMLSGMTVSNALILNFGSLDIYNNLLTLQGNAELAGNFGDNVMIRTSGDISSLGLRRNIVGSGEFLFPVGVTGKYTPVRLVVNQNEVFPRVQISPVNAKHPNITETGNLRYYWNVRSANVSGFAGSLNFHYRQSDVESDEVDFIAARLRSENWSKLTEDFVDMDSNVITYDHTVPVSDLSGEYTAGSNIPSQVLSFRAVASGDWSDESIWENITPASLPEDVPVGGPMGQIVKIPAGVSVSTESLRKIAYRTEVSGTLNVQPSASNHYLGNVSGDGKFYLMHAALPIGDYNAFFEGGTLEYSGNTNYSIDPARFPASGIHHIIFSGSGRRTLPAGILRVNGNADLRDQVEVQFPGTSTTLLLRGNLSKAVDAQMLPGLADPVIVFEGNAMQTLSGHFAGTNRLRNLTVNNSQGLTIAGFAEVETRLEFMNGRIYTTASNTLRLLNSTIVAGAGNNRFVHGPLQKRGNTRFVFPVGHNERMGRIAFRPEGASWNSNTILEARYITGTPPNNESGDGAPLAGVSSAEYWSFAPAADSPSGNISGRMELFIEDADFSGIIIPEQILVGWYDSPENVWRSAGGVNVSGSPDYIRSNVFNLSERHGLFSFGADAMGLANNPLPIELLSFSAKLSAGRTLIEWVTASEINNDYFTVERSADGIDFYAIGFVTGAGNSISMLSYQYYDNEPLEGISYYRLKQTDFDGIYSYSGIVAVQNVLRSNAYKMVLYPNPAAGGNVTIEMHTPASNRESRWQIALFDTYGRMVRSDMIETGYDGWMQYKWQGLNELPAGVYFVVLQNSEKRFTERLIIRNR